MNAHDSSGEHPKQEPSDLRPRAVAVVAVAVIMMVLLVAWVAHLLVRVSGASVTAATRVPIARAPRLSSHPQDDIAAFERGKRSQLETYGWVDREHTFTHIPIEQAMQDLAQKPSRQGPR